MACPTCDHTMQSVGGGIFWCPRCGTQKGDGGGVWVPKLVERCRLFEGEILDDPPGGGRDALLAWLARVGIPESINRPADRPPQE